MNVMRKKAAVKKYSPLKEEKELADVLEILQKDGYTEDEAIEITNVIYSDESTGEEKPKGIYFEEWRMEKDVSTNDGEVTTVKVSRLKRNRAVVKISQEEADTLNAGAISPGSSNPIMYLLPDEDLAPYTQKFKPKK